MVKNDLFDRMFAKRDGVSRIRVHDLPSWLFAYAVGDVDIRDILAEYSATGVLAQQLRALAASFDSLTTDDQRASLAAKIEFYCRIEERSAKPSRKRFKARLGI
jgi:hypothetical protein